MSQTGTAASVDARLAASDVGSFAVSYVRQNGQFRQINQDPSYRAPTRSRCRRNVRLDRFLPAVARAGGSAHGDLRAAPRSIPTCSRAPTSAATRSTGLRRPDSRSATYASPIRRSQPGTSWLTKGLVDPLSVAGALTRGRALTELSDARANTLQRQLNYLLQMRRQGFRLPLGGLVGGLPGWLRRSEVGKALAQATFSLAPTRIRLDQRPRPRRGQLHRLPRARRAGATTPLLQPTLALNHLWRNAAGLTWQPLGMLNLSGDLASTRDLRVYPGLDAARPAGLQPSGGSCSACRSASSATGR